jgi:hypothetical protein
MTRSIIRRLIGGFMFGHLPPSQKLLVTSFLLLNGRKTKPAPKPR